MSEIIDTKTIPHMKFTIPLPWNKKHPKRATYYIGCIKEPALRDYGKFQIHEKISGNDEGYGGATLEFLMFDGTFEKVKGPFWKDPSMNQRIFYDILAAIKLQESRT